MDPMHIRNQLDALARQAQLLKRWRKFLASDPLGLTEDDLEQAEVDGNSSEWIADPVSALAPHRCAEFRETTKALGEIQSVEGQHAWGEAYADTPALFRAACDFGESLEHLREAAEEDHLPSSRRHYMNEARAAWFRIATLAEDA